MKRDEVCGSKTAEAAAAADAAGARGATGRRGLAAEAEAFPRSMDGPVMSVAAKAQAASPYSCSGDGVGSRRGEAAPLFRRLRWLRTWNTRQNTDGSAVGLKVGTGAEQRGCGR